MPRVRFVERIAAAKTTLKISFDSSLPASGKPPKSRPEVVFIIAPRVKISSDLILVSLLKGQTSPAGVFDFSFIPEPGDLFLPVEKTVAIGEFFAQKIEVPTDGMGTVCLSGRSPLGAGRLRVWLDAREVGLREITDDGYFYSSFPLAASKGPHTLKSAFEPEGDGAAASKQGVPALWLDSITWQSPRRSLELPLYQLKSSDLRDAGTGTNPWGIKKKLRSWGTSWNALLAPAPSRFQFKVKVPANAVLRLGYGLLQEADETEGDGAGFEVSVESGGRTRVLMSDHLDPFRNTSDRGVFFKDIDLSAFGRRSVTLSLRTLGSSSAKASSPETEDLRGDLCFWENPLVFPKNAADGPKRKNVILISMDATRAGHLGCYGYGRDTTPVLDRLAKDSALFMNTISQAPYTLASHMTMLTGLYPTTHRVFYFSDTLDPSLPTLADQLRGQGVVTAAFTGGGLMDANYGYAHGFDEFHDHIVSQETSDTITPLAEQVSSWLARNADVSFFLFLHTYQVHSPYWPPAGYASKFLDKDAVWVGRSLEQFIGAGYVHKYRPLSDAQKRNVIALYDADINFLDAALIQPLLDALKERNLYDETMIIVTADHGEEFFDHVTWGHSNTLYNELLKVPLIVKFPESRYHGRRLMPFVRLADITPTVMEEFGVKRSPVKLDGESLLPILEDKEKGERLCLSYLPGNIFADPMPSMISLIQGRYKFILNEKFPARAFSYFSPPPAQPPPVELYDLRTDPQERKNLANQEGEVARRMLQQAQTFLQAAKREGFSKKALMDKELEERLRALGYIK
jgi:arylsulfatase A-like enzyme